MDKQFCATEFGTKFEAVATDRMAEVIGNVPRGVRPSQSRGFADAAVCKAIDFDVGRAKVCRGDASVESQDGGFWLWLASSKFWRK
jgi:hypothetical protein